VFVWIEGAGPGNPRTEDGTTIDKPTVLAALLAQLRDDLIRLEHITQMALDEATGDESRPENQYDTRSVESSYLARGQGERVLSLRRLVSFVGTLDPCTSAVDAPLGLWGLAELLGPEGTVWFLLAPAGGGRRIVVAAGQVVVVVTPGSPAGRALLGSRPGDAVTLGSAPAREYEVVSTR
jgi:hypothetical protein